MYHGILDTDFDKYTEDAVTLFRNSYGPPHGCSKTLRTSRWIGRRTPAAFIKFVRDHQCPSFLEYAEYPYASATEIKKALKLKWPRSPRCSTRCNDFRDGALGSNVSESANLRNHPRSAQNRRRSRCSRPRRYPAFPADAGPGAGGPIRISVISRWSRRSRLGVGNQREGLHSAASMRDGIDHDKRWVTAAFTWNGLRALGLDEASLASFPEEFKQGMAARAEMLGDAGVHAPEHWVGGLASPDLHAIVILFPAQEDDAEHDRCVSEHEKLIASCPGVEVLSVLDLHAIPPFGYAHEHFGYRDRLVQSRPSKETASSPSPEPANSLKPGRVHSWLPRRIRRHSRQPPAGNSGEER